MVRRSLALLLACASVVAAAAVANSAAPAPVAIDRAVAAQCFAVREQLPRRATIIGDSAMAGVPWNGALGGLRGFVADDRLVSSPRRHLVPGA
jgi:hypothetical protein